MQNVLHRFGIIGPIMGLMAGFHGAAQPPEYVRLVPLPAPRIVASAVAYPGGNFNVERIVDGNARTEYSSEARGTNTFIEFDFGKPVRIAAFRHIDRNDPALVGASELRFADAAGSTVSTLTVAHVRQRAGVTFFSLPAPVTAQRVRWRVAALGSPHSTVGGAEIGFYAAGEAEPLPRGLTLEARPHQMIERVDKGLQQPVTVTVDYPYAKPIEGTLRVGRGEPRPVSLKLGAQTFDFYLPWTQTDKEFSVAIRVEGKELAVRAFKRIPIRRWDIYILPHSHVDIGYTELQAEVEKKQNENIETALKLMRATKDYPVGSRFKWNVEVLWPVDNYLRKATPEQREDFVAMVKAGRIGLDGLYGNLLTGLCRPEELIRSLSYATRLSEQCGVPIESAMISDVPGYTWSTVPALAHGGVRYFSFAPNYFDRMGATMVTWQNQPFWWEGPDQKTRVLCWCPSRGYALGHLIGDGENLAKFLPGYLHELETNRYPYEVTHLRWNVRGDNGSPDERVSDVVREWNLRYASPRLIIATTAEAFREFEKRYDVYLPVYKGDYTPYWEDGAASSALETAMNRASAERLVQAESLWTMRGLTNFPATDFHEAWRNVLLYSEHTWGAHNSVSQPDLPFVRDQWKVKQAFALDADKQSRALLERGLREVVPGNASTVNASALDVVNTSSWERTGLVTAPSDLAKTGDRVVDEHGKAVPSQRLSTGELVFLAEKVPALGAKRYRVEAGAAPVKGSLKIEGAQLVHPDFTLRLDERTGAIASFYSRSAKAELVDARAATAVNDFFYLPGANVKDVKRNGPPRLTVKERGPLVASLLIESEAPGCHRLVREVRVVEGLDYVELINLVDKKAVREKEGVHFGFGFQIPDGTVRMDVGWAVVRPEQDQIPASCKNWFSVQRWVDIANDRYGITLAPVDAPLIEIGGLTANLIGSQTDHRVWISKLEPSQTVYSWVMNNHWHTNYRADQEGPTVFRYLLRPHKGWSPLDAARFGVNCSQPLIAAHAISDAPLAPRMTVSSDKVLVTACKPSDDGKGWMVRLFGASGRKEKVRLHWTEPREVLTWLSDTSEAPYDLVKSSVEVPAWGLVTLRVEQAPKKEKPEKDKLF